MFAGSPCPVCGELVAIPELAGHVNDCLDKQEKNSAKQSEELPRNAYFPPPRRTPSVLLDGSPIVAGGVEEELGGDWEVVSSPPGEGFMDQHGKQRGRKRRIIMDHITSMVSPKGVLLMQRWKPVAGVHTIRDKAR